MDNTALTTFVEHINWLVSHGPESGELSFAHVQDTLAELDRKVSESLSTAKTLTNVRPCLAKLMGSMALTPTIPVAVNAPAPLAPVPSTQVAATPVAGPYSATTTTPTVAPRASLASVPSYEPTVLIPSSPARKVRERNRGTPIFPPPVAPAYTPTFLFTSPLMEANERNTPTILPTTLPGVFPPAPPLRIMTGRVIIRPHDATRPIRSSTMNKGRGRAMDDRTQTAQLSHKRPRVITQGENDDNMPLGCYNDEAGSDKESQVSTQTTWLSSRASPIGGSHHGSTGQSESTSKIRDSLGIDITFELLDMALGEFPFVPLDVLPDLYVHIFGRELVPHDVDPQEFLLSLTKVDGFGYWYLQPEGADLDTSVGLSILERRGHKLEIIRKNITSRLELTEAQESTVVAPLLCYYLALLCCMRASLLTGPILSELFAKATGRSLESLRVVTEHGIQTMTGDELASMVRKWLKDLCSHIAAGDRAQELLDMATQCFDAYAYAHHENGIAYAWQAMLASNEHASQLLLGIPLIEMRWLYTRLLFLMDMDVDRATLRYLKSLSEQLLGQKK